MSKKTSKLFNQLLDAWAAVKKGKDSHKKGKITKDEMFDLEFYAFESEQEFIKQLEKIK
tara:strand:- start:68 stop:244 length:177 start_codon:yes stop_codon:yes gene_type:complete